ncbi:MAG: pilus assembly protein PilM [Planctomycetota bacterium]
MKLFKPRHSPIGLEFSSASLRAAQLERRGPDWTLRDAFELPRLEPHRPISAQEAWRLAQVICRRDFVGSAAVVALPNQQLIRGLIEVATPTATAQAPNPMLAAAQEIERHHGLEPGSYELAAWLPPPTSDRRRTAVCVAGCTHAVAAPVLDALTAAGLDPRVLDSRACAAARLSPTQPGAAPLTAAIDLEADDAELVLFHQQNVVYQRPLIDAGLDHAARRLTDRGLDADTARYALCRLGLNDLQTPHGQRVGQTLRAFAKHLAQEARPALDYAARLYPELPIKSFTLVGDGAAVPGLAYEVRQRLLLDHAPTRSAAFMNASGTTRTHPGPSADAADAFAVALGLALHPEETAWAA